MTRSKVTIDGNEAAARVAYRINEVIAIYPITPSSPMGEWADQWSAEIKPNIWGTVPHVIEMQSEGGAAGALHGALQAGSLGVTFTASQGLLLMIPNMFKIAGELTATVLHVTARTLAAHALSIFGDHSDVMATRSTGFGLLASNSVQEVTDFALIAQAAALQSRVPFLHFFDGFRTSHEVGKVEELTDDDLRALIPADLVEAHRKRALSPDHPFIRGTAQNPDVFFQARETVNPFYLACPAIVQNVMDKFASVVGRSYHLFDYVGAPDAERVIIMMGSGAEAAQETVEYLTERGEKVGVLKVRLYRPFSIEHFLAALPKTAKNLAVLDRTKEAGAAGEPLYVDVITALSEGLAAGKAPFASFPRIIGGRYGLSSKEFTPAMVKAVFDEMLKPAPRNHFTVGIVDDVTHTSLEVDPAFSTEDPKTVRAIFYGLGSDGTVGANKNSIKIIGEDTDNYAQGYFVYDSKKSGSITISHLRFGPKPIHSTYLITQANFVACHQFTFLERYDVLKAAEPGAVFLLNSPYGPDEVWDMMPRTTQRQIIQKKLRFFVIDAIKVAHAAGMGGRINTVMQTCFFAISGVLPREEAIAAIKHAIEKTYGRRGESVVQEELRRRGCFARSSPRGQGSGGSQQQLRHAPTGAVASPGVRARRAGQNHRGRRRFPAGQRHAQRRNLPQRHRAVGKAQHRAGNSRLGREPLHPVRQVRAGVPARRNPGQDLRPGAAGKSSRHLQVGRGALERIQGDEIHAASGAGGLHRLRAVRGNLPGQVQE